MEWYEWCRLCGKENGNQINVFIKEENSFSVADSLHQFFSIQVNDFDEVPKNICTFCHEFLSSLRSFSEKTKRVERMFLELAFNYKTGNKIDIYELRTKYNVENICFINEDINKIYSDLKYKVNSISCKDNIDELLINNESETKRKLISLTNIEKEPINNDLESKNELNCVTRLYSDAIVEEFKEGEISDLDIYERSRKKIQSKRKIKKNRKHGEDRKKFECEECKVQFVRESNYAYHLKKAHNIIKPLLPCNICGKSCKTKQKLKFHMELHLPPEERQKLLIPCPECDQKFTQKGAMQSHVRAQHSFEKPFVCEQCGKNFSSQTNLWSHRRSHDDQNHLTCPKCPKIFKNKFRLRVHMRGHNDSCHPCSICGLVLKTMNTLKNHMLVHSDAKPFKCNFCGKEFKRDKNLQSHMITHSGLRPFVCRFCGQSYANRSNCKKHEKHSHPNEYEAAASVTNSEPQQKVVKKLPNIQQLEAMLEQIKSDKGNN